MLIYVSGPYSADTEPGITKNIEQAAVIAGELWEMGHGVICPHTNTAGVFFKDCAATYDQYIQGDLVMIARCDALVMTPDWEKSKGARIEWAYANSLGIPVYVYPGLPDMHITEKRCPEQVKAFAEILGKMYRTHLQKNADYSPANILLTGEVGLVTRLWDKIARILNLTGFKIKVDVGTFDKPVEPSNESLEDSYLDAAVYSIIGLLLRRGAWGK